MDKEQEKKARLIIENQAKKTTLKAFRVGADEINFQILNSIPSTVLELKKKFNLSVMPLNLRLNNLEDAGLLIRDRKEGKVLSTAIGEGFLNLIDDIKEKVIKELERMVEDE